MSTMVADVGGKFHVSQLVGQGRRKKLPRHVVVVEGGDMAALQVEVAKQAEQSRIELGIQVKLRGLVD